MSISSPKVSQFNIGPSHSYQSVWELQRELQQNLVAAKRAGNVTLPGYLLLCEHSPVYTLGKSGKMAHLLVNKESLKQKGTQFFKINRGGDITYHGPGQITGYPILDLGQYYHDLHRYVRELEEVIIQVLSHFELKGERIKEFTGVWLKNVDGSGYRKICAIGVHMSRWVSMHGFALNVNTDLSYFDNIVACGITANDLSVTSLQNELGSSIDIRQVKELIKEKFEIVFGCQILT